MKKIIFLFIAIIAVAISLVFVMDKKEKKSDTVQTDFKKESDFTLSEESSPNIKKINVPTICQHPELPTGCEAVAATMVLQYYEENITAANFASEWLRCSESFYTVNGQMYGPDPNEVFAGNPFSENSYGCFAGAIVNAINGNSINCKAKKLKAKSVEQLCNEYIDNNHPVLIWATMGMKQSKNGRSWKFENGEKFTWIAGEHCLVLVGYDDEYYFLNDPQSGSTVAYQKDIVEKRFKELGFQAVHIYRI